MKIELTNQQIQLLEMGKKINTGKNTWYYLPYWYKHVEGNTFEEISLEQLPEGLKKYLENIKNKK